MSIRGLEDLTERLADLLPPQVAPLRDELRANFKAVLQSRISRLDLVPREEFDATRDMLAHTRSRLEELERKVAELEAQDNATDSDA